MIFIVSELKQTETYLTETQDT